MKEYRVIPRWLLRETGGREVVPELELRRRRFPIQRFELKGYIQAVPEKAVGAAAPAAAPKASVKPAAQAPAGRKVK